MFVPEVAYLYPKLMLLWNLNTYLSFGLLFISSFVNVLFSNSTSILLDKFKIEVSHAKSNLFLFFDRKCFLISAGILLLNVNPSLFISLWTMFVQKCAIKPLMPLSAFAIVSLCIFPLSIFAREKRTLLISFWRFLYSYSYVYLLCTSFNIVLRNLPVSFG